MKLEALRFADFSKLGTAVDDWTAMIDKLKSLAEDAKSQLSRQAQTANWRGVNATVTKEFIEKTAGEFDDAVKQATTIRNILQDTRGELVDYRRQLNEAIDRGLKKNLTVTSTGGGGFTVTMNIHPDRAAKGTDVPDHSQQDVTALRDEVQSILSRATESDDSAAEALRAIVGSSPMGFADSQYADRDAAAQAIKNGKRAADLGKKGYGMSPQEFDELNRLLEQNNGDALFSEKFATGLGADGTMKLWAGLNNPVLTAESGVGRDRHDQLDDLQRNLGLTLATATQSDSAAVQGWEDDVVKNAGKPIEFKGAPQGDLRGPMGFQVMSNLMRSGDWDDRYLGKYGDELMRTEKQLSNNGNSTRPWYMVGTEGGFTDLNRLGNDEDDHGLDPMTGYLQALAKSPDASTEFFHDPFLTPGEDEDKGAMSNFDYLFKKREWFEAEATGRNAMADAIEAGVTGDPAGSQPNFDPHTPEQAQLMRNVFGAVSGDPTLLTDHKEMADSFGRMSSEYLPDMYRALHKSSDTTNNLFPVNGAAVFGPQDETTGHIDVTRFLASVGQDPDGYAALSYGQKAYAANIMEYQLNPDVQAALPPEQRFAGSHQSAIQGIVSASSEVSGDLAIGRQEATIGDAVKSDADYDASVSRYRAWGASIAGVAAGIGTAGMASPVAAATVTGLINSGTLLGGNEADIALSQNQGAEAAEKAAIYWADAKDTDQAVHSNVLNEIGKKYNIPGGDFDSWVQQASDQGFNSSRSNVQGFAPYLDSSDLVKSLS